MAYLILNQGIIIWSYELIFKYGSQVSFIKMKSISKFFWKKKKFRVQVVIEKYIVLLFNNV